MFKTTLTIVMAALCLNLSAQTTPQTPNQNKATDLVAKGIQVGQPVPDVTLTGIHNYKAASGSAITAAKLSDFKGKLLIFDFWATWCSPCVAMFPKMEALQQQFQSQLQIIKVTYQQQAEVLPFLQKLQKGKTSNLPDVMGDKALHKLFPHLYLPHYVWIDGQGKVCAITGLEEINAQNISKMLGNTSATLKTKSDMKRSYDENKPLFLNGNGGDGQNITQYSMFSGYVDGLSGSYTTYPPDSIAGQRVTIVNLPMHTIYRQVLTGIYKQHFPLSRIVLDVKDTTRVRSKLKGEAYREWQKQGNSFCYEIIIPLSQQKNLYQLMRNDFDRAFSKYKVTVEKRKIMCRVLKRTSNVDKIKSAGGQANIAANATGAQLRNAFLGRFFEQLEVYYMQNSPYPMVNETGYTGRVDMDIEAPLGDVKAMNAALAKYDLQFVDQARETQMVIIRDNPEAK